MKNVTEILKLISCLLVINLLLTSCKAEVTNEGDPKPAFSRGIVFRVHCSKMILVRLNDSLKKVEYTDAASEGSSKKQISNKEFIGEFVYRLTEYADGSKELDCQLSDGLRQYTGSKSISSRTAYMSDNLCSIVYDLDTDATNGSFNFWWTNSQRGLSYNDDYGYNKEMYVRSSECSEL